MTIVATVCRFLRLGWSRVQEIIQHEPILSDFRGHQEPYQQLNNRESHSFRSGNMQGARTSKDIIDESHRDAVVLEERKSSNNILCLLSRCFYGDVCPSSKGDAYDLKVHRKQGTETSWKTSSALSVAAGLWGSHDHTLKPKSNEHSVPSGSSFSAQSIWGKCFPAFINLFWNIGIQQIDSTIVGERNSAITVYLLE